MNFHNHSYRLFSLQKVDFQAKKAEILDRVLTYDNLNFSCNLFKRYYFIIKI